MAAAEGVRRQVLVPQDIWDAVRRIATLDRTSVSQVAREALRDYVNKRITQARRAKAARAG